MSYVFENHLIGTTKATIAGSVNTHTLNGINTVEQNADSIMSAINDLYGIVGWSTTEVTRNLKQDVVEE